MRIRDGRDPVTNESYSKTDKIKMITFNIATLGLGKAFKAGKNWIKNADVGWVVPGVNKATKIGEQASDKGQSIGSTIKDTIHIINKENKK